MADQLRYTLMLRVYGEERIFGPGIAELLERVEQTHSLRKATADMGMAYSKAWRTRLAIRFSKPRSAAKAAEAPCSRNAASGF